MPNLGIRAAAVRTATNSFGRTGETVKSYTVDSQVRSQPAIENGNVYISTQDGKVI